MTEIWDDAEPLTEERLDALSEAMKAKGKVLTKILRFDYDNADLSDDRAPDVIWLAGTANRE